MVKLKTGIEVPQKIVDDLLSNGKLSVHWETIDHIPHPCMDDTQHSVVPRMINECKLPSERIAYYLITRFQDENGVTQEVYMVENSSAFVEVGRTEYTACERKSIPANSKAAAEKMVIGLLRDFINSELPD